MRTRSRPRPRTVLALLLALALPGASGCKEFRKLEKLDFSKLPLPKDADGDYLLIEISGSRLAIKPLQDDAVTAVGTCADLVEQCYAPPATTLDDCMGDVPICRTKRPWEEDEDCCPDDCVDAYRRERKAGRGELEAFEKVLFLQPDCFPGVKAALEGR